MASRSRAKPPASEPFTGFTDDTFDFFRALALKQSREWFEEQREVYEREVKGRLSSLVTDVTAELRRRKVPLQGDPKRSLFRIHRDTRFSRNKDPYHTHGAIALSRDGERKSAGLVYVHFEPRRSFVAGGFYSPPPELLLPLRKAMRDRTAAWTRMLAGLAANGLTLERDEMMKRRPRGFEDVEDPKVADAVRFKSLYAYRELTAKEVRTNALVGAVADFSEALLPLLRWGWAILPRDARTERR